LRLAVDGELIAGEGDLVWPSTLIDMPSAIDSCVTLL
jgi:hypothetical protein